MTQLSNSVHFITSFLLVFHVGFNLFLLNNRAGLLFTWFTWYWSYMYGIYLDIYNESMKFRQIPFTYKLLLKFLYPISNLKNEIKKVMTDTDTYSNWRLKATWQSIKLLNADKLYLFLTKVFFQAFDKHDYVSTKWI